MAQYDQDLLDELDALLNPPKPAKQPIDPVRRPVADFIRAVGERAVPLSALAVRGGSGILSAGGWAPGAAISAAGETLAQMIENQSTDLDKIKKGRVLVEGGIGAVPFGKLIKAGSAGVSALKGAALGTAGTVGRKVADAREEGSLEPLKEWSLWDALPTLLGGGVSAGIGKYTKAAPEKAPDFEVERVPGQKIKTIGPSDSPPPPGTPPPPPTDPDPFAKVSYGAGSPVPYRQAAVASQKAENEAAEDILERGARNDKATEAYKRKIEQARAAADAEEEARRINATVKEGLEPKAPTASESSSFTEGGVRSSTTQKFAAPEEDIADAAPRPNTGRPSSMETSGKSVMSAERAAHVVGQDAEAAVQPLRQL